jgi:HEAT repeat protein
LRIDLATPSLKPSNLNAARLYAKQPRIVLGLLLVGILVIPAWYSLFRFNQTTAGRPLAYWLDNWWYESALEQAVEKEGTNAVPTLLRLLHQHDSPLMTRIMAVVGRQDFVHFNYGWHQDRNRTAYVAFRKLGDAAKAAVPDLIEIYQEGIPESARAYAARSLGAIGPAASRAFPLLMRGTTNSSLMVRRASLRALADLHFRVDLAVPVLVASLGDTNPRVQLTACSALASLGADARQATPALARLRNDSEAAVRSAAIEALQSIEAANAASPNQVTADAAINRPPR